jgi:hypothetical protein
MEKSTMKFMAEIREILNEQHKDNERDFKRQVKLDECLQRIFGDSVMVDADFVTLDDGSTGIDIYLTLDDDDLEWKVGQ